MPEDAIDETYSAIQALGDARQHTAGAGTARVELLVDHTWEMPVMPQRQRSRLMRPVVRGGKTAGKRLLPPARLSRGAWTTLRSNSDFNVVQVQPEGHPTRSGPL